MLLQINYVPFLKCHIISFATVLNRKSLGITRMDGTAAYAWWTNCKCRTIIESIHSGFVLHVTELCWQHSALRASDSTSCHVASQKSHNLQRWRHGTIYCWRVTTKHDSGHSVWFQLVVFQHHSMTTLSHCCRTSQSLHDIKMFMQLVQHGLQLNVCVCLNGTEYIDNNVSVWLPDWLRQ